MLIYIVVLAIGMSTVNAAPHHDGTNHTHPPIIAPDSESIISVDNDKYPDTHHSDIYLSKTNTTGPSQIAQAKAVDATDVHHSDEFMMGTEERDGANNGVSSAEETTTTPSSTIVTTVKDIPVTSAPKNDGKSKSKSVVAHGPMAKNVDDHKKHDPPRQNDKTKHSVVHHAPMASEHHFAKFNAHNPPPKSNPNLKSDDKAALVHHAPTATDHSKSSLVAHPSLSKTEPAILGSHPPGAIPKPHESSTTDATKEEVPTESSNPEVSTDQPADNTKTIVVHHPFLSKTEPASYVGAHVLVGVPRISSPKKFA